MNVWRGILRVVTALLVACAPAGAAQEASDVERRDAVERLIDRWAPEQLEQLRIPGAVVVIADASGVVYARGFGMADEARSVPMDAEETVLRLGSISKPVTAIAALRLVEEGAIGLHDSVEGLLADLPLHPEFDTALTLHHLLTQTAGFNDWLLGQHVLDADAFVDLETFLRRRLPPRFAPPGEAPAYNDHHTTLAGLLVERLAGAPFADVAQRTVFDPLGMTSSSFRQADLDEALARRLASGHRLVGDAFVPYERDLILTAPAAGLVASGADIGRLMSAMLRALDGASTGPVTPRVVELMTARRYAARPELPARGYELYEMRRPGTRVLYKDGQVTGFHARVLLVPDRRLGLFIAVNRSILAPGGGTNEAAGFVRGLSDEFLDAVAPVTPTETAAPRPAQGADERTPAYAGLYRSTVQSRHTWQRIIALYDDIRVVTRADGVVELDGAPYVEVAPGLVQWHAGGPYYGAFSTSDERRPRYLFLGLGAYERAPWFSGSVFSERFVATTGAVFAVGLIAFPALAIRRRRRIATRTAFLLLTVHASCALVFLAAIASLFLVYDPQTLFRGPPPMFRVASFLPVISGVALLAGVAAAALAARRKELGWPSVSVALLYTLAGASHLVWLAFWNLITPLVWA